MKNTPLSFPWMNYNVLNNYVTIYNIIIMTKFSWFMEASTFLTNWQEGHPHQSSAQVCCHWKKNRDCTSGVRKIWKQPNRRCFQPKFAKVKALLYQWGLSGNKAILWAYGVMNWGLGFLESFMSSTCSILVILIVTRQVLLSPGSSQPYLCTICIFYHSGEILWSFRIKHWD